MKIARVLLLAGLVLLSFGAGAQTPHSPSIEDAFLIPRNSQIGAWVVKKTQWSAADEQGFGDFIARIAKSRCYTVDNCIKNPANPYYNPAEDKPVFYYADCGRFPYLMRMYYAWKNNLPFSAVSRVSGTPEDVQAWVQQQIAKGNPHPNPANGFPTNSSEHGNVMLSRLNIPDSRNITYNFYRTAFYVINRVNTADYRFDVERQMPVMGDFYPVDISREGIRPGVTLYDPAGHVTLVYEVTPDGEVKYIDAHPDNSVSRGVYNKTFERSRPAHGAGFKAFRPMVVENAVTAADGSIHGDVVTVANDKLPDFSLVQMYGTKPDPQGRWSKGPFIYNGESVDVYEYIKLKLATSAQKINPADQLGKDLDALCSLFQDRIPSVQQAVDAGIPQMQHPDRMPKNIYSDSGDWEAYSTPGRDIRLKMGMVDLLDTAKRLKARLAAQDPLLISPVNYDIQKEYLKAAQASNQRCPISYLNSQKQKITIDLFEAIRRLGKISFDPYMCPERRWGASGSELGTCVEDSEKHLWYDAQQFYRNRTEKVMTYDNDYDLTTLQQVNQQQRGQDLNIDLLSALRSL